MGMMIDVAYSLGRCALISRQSASRNDFRGAITVMRSSTGTATAQRHSAPWTAQGVIPSKASSVDCTAPGPTADLATQSHAGQRSERARQLRKTLAAPRGIHPGRAAGRCRCRSAHHGAHSLGAAARRSRAHTCHHSLSTTRSRIPSTADVRRQGMTVSLAAEAALHGGRSGSAHALTYYPLRLAAEPARSPWRSRPDVPSRG